MASFLALVLEKFTIEIIPKLPIFIRTPIYVNILKLRKVRDRIRFDVTKKNPTFQDRLNYAIDSRANLNNSGERILSFNDEVLMLSLIHISEPTRPLYISYAVFCLKKK